MFKNNQINISRYVKNARDAHVAFGVNLGFMFIPIRRDAINKTTTIELLINENFHNTRVKRLTLVV